MKSSHEQSQREADLEYALLMLCNLKKYKDRNGRTALYQATQISVWESAFELVNMT